MVKIGSGILCLLPSATKSDGDTGGHEEESTGVSASVGEAGSRIRMDVTAQMDIPPEFELPLRSFLVAFRS